jgi:hypothetical protein
MSSSASPITLPAAAGFASATSAAAAAAAGYSLSTQISWEGGCHLLILSHVHILIFQAYQQLCQGMSHMWKGWYGKSSPWA